MNKIAELSTRIPFGKPKGYPIRAYKSEGTAGIMTDQPVKPGFYPGEEHLDFPVYMNSADPGVVGYPFIPSFGISNSPDSAINTAMLKEVGTIAEKGKLSYIANIDANDLGMMYCAIESAMLWYNHGARIKTYYKTFHAEDLYLVKGLYDAMHVDYDDMLSNMPQLLVKLNEYQARLDRLRLPKKFETINDHFYMTSKIFKDCDLDKSMKMVEYPKVVFKYDPKVPALVAIDVDTEELLTFERWTEVMEQLVGALIPDEDISNLTAYLRLAYNDDELYKVHGFDWSSFAELVYDQEEVKALHHACFLNYSSVSGLNVTQVVTDEVNFRLEWDPLFTVPSLGCNAKRVFDIKSNQPTNEEVYAASKYMWTCKVVSANGNGGTIRIGNCSSAIMCNPHIIVFDEQMNTKELPLYNEIIPATHPKTSPAGSFYFGWSVDHSYDQVEGFMSMIYMSRYHAAPIVNVLMVENETAPESRRNKLVVYNAMNVRYNSAYVDDVVLDDMLHARTLSNWALE